MLLLPSQSISTPPFSSSTTSPTAVAAAVELNGAVSRLTQLPPGNERAFLLTFLPRWESFGRSEFPTDTPPASIRPCEMSHDQEMAIGGSRRIKVCFGGAGKIDSPETSATPVLIRLREPRNYQLEMAAPIRGGDSYSNYLQSAGVQLSSGGNLDNQMISTVPFMTPGPDDPTAIIITFEFDDGFPDEAKPAVHRAFATWEEPLNLRFFLSWMPPGLANFKIGMYRGDHGDSKPFEAGTLAHSNTPRPGHLYFNLDQPWWYKASPPPADSYDIESVAVCQIGRLLGLRYSFDPKSVMFKYIVPGYVRRGLTQADRDELERLYPIN